MMYTVMPHSYSSVYGPVHSWRYGRSLGIDPIGAISTCPFDCVYCQLGEIEHKQRDRQLFIPTLQILDDLHNAAPWDVDVITISGSGEPTLALNLGEIIGITKALTDKPIGVLTNGCLLGNSDVREELSMADQVAVKVDAVSPDQFRRINRPMPGIELNHLLRSLQAFRQHYSGHLAIQTMVLSAWKLSDQETYIDLMKELAPDEIQLNTPTRPRPLTHQLDARGNHSLDDRPYPVRHLQITHAELLQAFRDRIVQATGILVRSPTSR